MTTNPHELEFLGTKIFLKLLKSINFTTNKEKLFEGTLADLLLKTKDGTNKYYGIQLKTCGEEYKYSYQFNHTKGYTGLILVCICISEEKVWIMPGELTNKNETLKIGKTEKSKYHKYLVNKNDIVDNLNHIIKNYNLQYKYFKDWNIPISKEVQKEAKYFYQHRKLFPFNLKRPNIENSHIDSYIKINNIKIRFQHKANIIRRKNKDKKDYINLHLRKHFGMVNNKCTRGPYDYNDFDIVFLHIDDKEYQNKIILIPMSDLVSRHYVNYGIISGSSSLLIPMDYLKCRKNKKVIDKWVVNSYLFDLTNKEDIERIKDLLSNIAEYKKKGIFIEKFPLADECLEYYAPKDLDSYIEKFKLLCRSNKINPKFENYNQFKLFIKKYKDYIKILRPESSYKSEWISNKNFLSRIHK